MRLTCDEECGIDDPMICDAGLVYAVVNNSGLVSSCDLLEQILPNGSLSLESFFKIWNDCNRWKDYRQIFSLNQECLKCGIENRKLCFGKCKALSYLKQGSLTMNQKPNERRCWI